FAAVIKSPESSLLMVPVNGLLYLASTLILWILSVALFVLWWRVLTTLMLANATGLDVLDDVGLVDVYAEPLPRWSSHKNCRLEILHRTGADLAGPSAHGKLHASSVVQQRVAEWIAERAKELDRPRNVELAEVRR